MADDNFLKKLMLEYASVCHLRECKRITRYRCMRCNEPLCPERFHRLNSTILCVSGFRLSVHWLLLQCAAVFLQTRWHGIRCLFHCRSVIGSDFTWACLKQWLSNRKRIRIVRLFDRRNARGGEGRRSPRKPADLGIVLHVSHMRKPGSDLAGDRARFALAGGEQSNRSATAAPSMTSKPKQTCSRRSWIRAFRAFNIAGGGKKCMHRPVIVLILLRRTRGFVCTGRRARDLILDVPRRVVLPHCVPVEGPLPHHQGDSSLKGSSEVKWGGGGLRKVPAATFTQRRVLLESSSAAAPISCPRCLPLPPPPFTPFLYPSTSGRNAWVGDCALSDGVSRQIWVALNIEVLRADESDTWRENLPTNGIVRHDSNMLKVQDRPHLESNPVSHDSRLPSACSALEADRRGSVKGDTATRIKSPIATKRTALNWRAVFSSCCVYRAPASLAAGVRRSGYAELFILRRRQRVPGGAQFRRLHLGGVSFPPLPPARVRGRGRPRHTSPPGASPDLAPAVPFSCYLYRNMIFRTVYHNKVDVVRECTTVRLQLTYGANDSKVYVREPRVYWCQVRFCLVLYSSRAGAAMVFVVRLPASHVGEPGSTPGRIALSDFLQM
ncbi:hypothetical protein PR048_010552 [Dryococelus australis]|uniref:Uncharacterized protein n=1 Tax=Dryococelus australis TaxID=614101 RepID=A0ABQ9I333_9NEOP|nr:hypothetical protein PR048_010552 [Dryococelus australis]